MQSGVRCRKMSPEAVDRWASGEKPCWNRPRFEDFAGLSGASQAMVFAISQQVRAQ